MGAVTFPPGKLGNRIVHERHVGIRQLPPNSKQKRGLRRSVHWEQHDTTPTLQFRNARVLGGNLVGQEARDAVPRVSELKIRVCVHDRDAAKFT